MPDVKILLLGHARETGLELARMMLGMGYRPMAASWRDFHPRSRRRDRPAAILANIDHPSAPNFGEFSLLVRKFWGEQYPLFAMTADQKVSHISSVLDAGASDCLPAMPAERLLERKISRAVRQGSARPASELADEVPAHLFDLFGNPNLIRLGDIASIHAGAAPRRAWSRRASPPDDAWRGVATSGIIGRFFAGKPEAYLLWSRFHLFRVPERSEYDVPEKVLLSRAGPPLVAAVDKSRIPAGGDMYSLVPREGVGAGYLACLLNSRLLDFYCNRLAGAPDSRLRAETIRALPVPDPGRAAVPMQDFARYATLLAHFGPNPQSWIDRQSRDEVWEEMENAVFALYGAGSEAREGLAAMHF